jgi:prepilin-type N-terminal cleavage/methylation domain-containing protein
MKASSSRSFPQQSHSSGFTMIELLVVIAIIAILAVVVILTLNPAALLQESRDSNRLSDLSLMSDAVNVYNTDQSGASSYFLGSASTAYISIADLSATSTAGTNCATMGLPATSTGWSDHCAASSTNRSVNNTGWFPINFSNISSGAPFGSLPVDPTNNTSSLLYYTYMTNGNQYELTVPLESTKYLKQNLLTTDIDPSRVAAGSNSGLVSQSEGLMGYWNFEEGGGTTTLDQSGNGNNGTWSGSAPFYSTAAKVGSYAGDITSNPGGVSILGNSAFNLTNFSGIAWINSSVPYKIVMADGLNSGGSCASGDEGWYFSQWAFDYCNGSNTSTIITYTQPSTSTWHQVAFSFTSGHSLNIYVDGLLVQSSSVGTVTYNATPLNFSLGAQQNMYNTSQGLIDDVRVYNRALSATEIQAVYSAEK